MRTLAKVRKVQPYTHGTIFLLDDSRIPRGEHCWVVQWRSSSMTAPAFWYFRTRKEARATCVLLRK